MVERGPEAKPPAETKEEQDRIVKETMAKMFEATGWVVLVLTALGGFPLEGVITKVGMDALAVGFRAGKDLKEAIGEIIKERKKVRKGVEAIKEGVGPLSLVGAAGLLIGLFSLLTASPFEAGLKQIVALLTRSAEKAASS